MPRLWLISPRLVVISWSSRPVHDTLTITLASATLTLASLTPSQEKDARLTRQIVGLEAENSNALTRVKAAEEARKELLANHEAQASLIKTLEASERTLREEMKLSEARNQVLSNQILMGKEALSAANVKFEERDEAGEGILTLTLTLTLNLICRRSSSG